MKLGTTWSGVLAVLSGGLSRRAHRPFSHKRSGAWGYAGQYASFPLVIESSPENTDRSYSCRFMGSAEGGIQVFGPDYRNYDLEHLFADRQLSHRRSKIGSSQQRRWVHDLVSNWPEGAAKNAVAGVRCCIAACQARGCRVARVEASLVRFSKAQGPVEDGKANGGTGVASVQ